MQIYTVFGILLYLFTIKVASIATATFYSALLIQRCMDLDSDIKTYPGIGNRAFRKKGRLIVHIQFSLPFILQCRKGITSPM
ncbi:hypothetical protein HRI_004083300 [Hibiscus trionum]|uniref:Uncharacterized protein n=1 Tax=Hibiscus trionum TaxID=183268 RepID=A0A9W7IY80_HIBTR|nr:hypothetical protein HRI_004083300 [Hibiscus trionum]